MEDADIKEREDKIYSKALDMYGIEAQMRQFMEEASETIIALNKYMRAADYECFGDDYKPEKKKEELDRKRRDVIGEMADLRVMMGQMLLIFSDPGSSVGYRSEEFQEAFEKKLEELRADELAEMGEHGICQKCIHDCKMPGPDEVRRHGEATWCYDFDEAITSWKDRVEVAVEYIIDEMADPYFTVGGLKTDIKAYYDEDEFKIGDDSLSVYISDTLRKMRERGDIEKCTDRGKYMKLAEFNLAENNKKMLALERELFSRPEESD